MQVRPNRGEPRVHRITRWQRDLLTNSRRCPVGRPGSPKSVMSGANDPEADQALIGIPKPLATPINHDKRVADKLMGSTSKHLSDMSCLRTLGGEVSLSERTRRLDIVQLRTVHRLAMFQVEQFNPEFSKGGPYRPRLTVQEGSIVNIRSSSTRSCRHQRAIRPTTRLADSPSVLRT